MSELITQATEDPTTAVVDFGIADEIVASLIGRFADAEANTKEGYELVRAGIVEVRTLRTGVEKSRKVLKQSALDWGRKVDAEAKRVTGQLLPIEERMKALKETVDGARAKARQEADMKAQREMEERAAQEREQLAKMQAEQMEMERKQREAEAEKLAAERKRLDEEREEMERQKQKLVDERAAIDAERKAVADAAEALERKKLEAKELAAKKKRIAQEEKQRIAAEAKQKQEDEEKAEADRIEAERVAEERKPDADKLLEWAVKIHCLVEDVPTLKTAWGNSTLSYAMSELVTVARSLENL